MSKFIAKVLLVFILIFTLLATSTVFTNAAGSIVTFTPTEISSVLNNPYMGWAPWASGGPYQQPHRLVYINVTWRELEPTKGNYDFNTLETVNKFSYWAQNGKKIILRINMDYPEPTSHKDIPDWLYNEINGDGTWYNLDWGMGFSPNYNNPKLIEYHKALITALGARYNNNNLIPIIALGSVGHWGEFHTKKSDAITIPFPNESVTNQYVQPYIDNFKNKILVMRRPFQIARDNGMGLFNDSFGSTSQTYSYFNDYINNGYTDYLTGEFHPAMPDYWKTAPSGGEIASYPGNVYLQDSTVNTSLQMLRDSHTSWLGPCSPGFQATGSSLQKNFDLMLTTMGYRFVIQSVSHLNSVNSGDSLPITMNWINKGVAPFYYNWPLELSLSDASGNIVAKSTTTDDIRTWLPGSKSISPIFNIPSNLPAGNYNLCVGIIDPETGLPGIDLAIADRRADGRYTVSQINVTKPSVVSNISISNQGSATIPAAGSNTYNSTAIVKDQAGNIMPNEKVQWSLTASTPGVTIDSTTGLLSVSSGATPGAIGIKAVSISSPSIGSTVNIPLVREASVVTSAEITGSTFVEIPRTGLIYSDYKAALKDQFLTVMPDQTVKWSLASPVNGVSIDAVSGKLVVDSSAKAGNINIIARSNTNTVIFASKELTLYVKFVPVVTSIEITGSTYIKIPTSSSKVTYSDYKAVVKDQNASVMPDETVTWSLNTTVTGITLDSNTGKLVVSSTAKPVSVILTAKSASNGAIKVTKNLILIN